MSNVALIIFAKRPALGQGKQRLALETSKEVAFSVAQALLENTLKAAEKIKYDIILSPSSSEDVEWAHALLRRNVICIPQRDGDLGERLLQIDREVRMLGYGKTIFIGTDAPTLTANDVKTASSALDLYQQVFIPASDGGVVLMASRKPWAQLDKIEWSTEKVFSQLKSIAVARGLSVRILETQTDLDDLSAYRELRQQLNGSKLKPLLEPYL